MLGKREKRLVKKALSSQSVAYTFARMTVVLFILPTTIM